MKKRVKYDILFACVTVLSIVLIVLLYFHTEKSEARVRSEQRVAVQFQMHPQRGIRIVSNGIVVALSAGGEFSMYKRRLDGGRSILLQGPWQGESTPHLKAHSPNHYTVTGQSKKDGASYTIDYRIDSDNTIRIKHNFIAPKALSAVEYELLRLPSDLFRGAAIKSDSQSISDAKILPYNPQEESKRFLLKNKNTLTVQGSFCDVEIEDITGSRGINVADFRGVSWASMKGFYVYSNPQLVVPGKAYTFEYAIRLYPPSGKAPPEGIFDSSSFYRDAQHAGSFFAISPKSATSTPGNYILSEHVGIYSDLPNIGEILSAEISKKSGIKLHRGTISQTTKKDGIFVSIATNKELDLPAEGFEIRINDQNIIIRGRDQRGCLYGVYTLLDRLKQEGSRWHIPCGVIRDWPDVKVRAHMTEIMPTHVRDVAIFKKYLTAVSRARGNTVIFYFYPRHIKVWKTGNDIRWWTKKEMAEIALYAKSLSLDVWAGMSVQIYPQKDTEFDIIAGSNFYNPSNPESYNTLYKYYQEIIDTFQPTTFLIGHDEIKGLLRYSDKSGIRPSDMLADDINKIHRWLKERNIRTALWGDMLLDNTIGKYYPANSRNPAYNSGETHQAIEQISKEVIIMDWHYQASDTYSSITYFQRKGFQVVGSLWHTPVVARKMAMDVKTNNALGVASTDWGFWYTLSPAATTLYSSIFGWSTQHNVDDKGLDIQALADSLKDKQTDEAVKQAPVDLSGYVNVSTWDVGTGSGIFNKGPLFDLSQFPEGTQIARAYRFVIANAMKGLENNVLAIDQKKSASSIISSPKKSIVISGQHAKALAFLHTCYFDLPGASPRKIGYYELEYIDGTKHRMDLIEGWNIRDIRSGSDGSALGWNLYRYPDILSGAYLAWRGRTTSGIPLSLNVFVMENPSPLKPISKVNIYTLPLDDSYRIVILGVTLLR